MFQDGRCKGESSYALESQMRITDRHGDSSITFTPPNFAVRGGGYKSIFRPIDPILFWLETVNRHLFFFALVLLPYKFMVAINMPKSL